MKPTDCFRIYLAGINAHKFVQMLSAPGSPFASGGYASVTRDVIINDVFVGGVVEVWVHEHFTSAQQQFLRDQPYIIAVHQAFP